MLSLFLFLENYTEIIESNNLEYSQIPQPSYLSIGFIIQNKTLHVKQ